MSSERPAPRGARDSGGDGRRGADLAGERYHDDDFDCPADWCRKCFVGCIHDGKCRDCGAVIAPLRRDPPPSPSEPQDTRPVYDPGDIGPCIHDTPPAPINDDHGIGCAKWPIGAEQSDIGLGANRTVRGGWAGRLDLWLLRRDARILERIRRRTVRSIGRTGNAIGAGRNRDADRREAT